MQQCPCGRKMDYQDCCGKYIEGGEIPAHPEALMRSRYTAYHQVNVDYIAETMKSPAADGFDPEGTRAWAKKVKWDKLEVVAASAEENIGYVEFKAYYTAKNKQHVLHEKSEFHLIDGRWYYVNGMYD